MLDINQPIPVLDKGFVRLVDVFGSDERVVEAARVSYGGESSTKVRSTESLIRYLWSHHHTTPFEQCSVTLHIKAPLFVARQWLRHRTAKPNEISGRYSVMKDEFYVPDLHRLTTQSIANKQGSSDTLVEDASQVREGMQVEQDLAYAAYESYLSTGLSKEIARINLPLSLYTEWYWTMDLHNLLKFLQLRMDSHAQYEIAVYAESIFDLVCQLFPLSATAFMDYTLNSVSLNSMEISVLREWLCTQELEPHPKMSSREWEESKLKIEQLIKGGRSD